MTDVSGENNNGDRFPPLFPFQMAEPKFMAYKWG